MTRLEITGWIIKNGVNFVVNWLCRISNITFKIRVIIPLYKGKHKKCDCISYRCTVKVC